MSRKFISILFLLFSWSSYSQISDCAEYVGTLNKHGPMSSSWHQGSPYSDNAISCANNNTLIGCGAIAVGQILNYYNYPNFPITYTGYGYTECEENEFKRDEHEVLINYNIFSGSIEDFLLDVALSLETTFGKQISTTYFDYIASILNYRFGYADPRKIVRNENLPNDKSFWDQIKFELYNCRPVIVAATKPAIWWGASELRHGFVIDDYQYDNVNKISYYHVNFGVTDTPNGWYTSDLDGFNENVEAIINIVPPGVDACCYLNNVTPPYNNTYPVKEQDHIFEKSSACNNIVYPINGSDLVSNKLKLFWSSPGNVTKQEVDVYDLDNNSMIYSGLQTYAGHSALNSDLALPPSTNIQYTIREYDISNSLLNSCTHSIITKDSICDLRVEYFDYYCIGNGSQYVVEVDFEGNNTSYDVFAEWDGIVYDSENSVAPGFVILGPFNTTQRVALIIEDELNPHSCVVTEVTAPIYLNSNCLPNPITAANGGHTQNAQVSCPAPSGFSRTVSNNEVTYNWTWGSNSQNLIIEEVFGQNILDTHVIENDGTTSVTISYDPCAVFDVRAKFDCGQYFSPYTSSLNVNLTYASCNSTLCPMPSNVYHTINSGNPDILDINWSQDGNSHEICFYENGSLLNCSIKPPAQTSTGIFMTDCENYDYKIRSICGSENSNWLTNNESIQTGNNCGALTDLRADGTTGTVVITPTKIHLNDLDVINDGNYAVNNIVIDMFLVKANGNPPMTYVSSNTYNFPPNTIRTMSFSFNINDFLPPGILHYSEQYKLHIVVDSNNSEPERIETNNTLILHQNILHYGCSDSAAQPVNYHVNANVNICFYCNDGIKNGYETEIDCGGPFCDPCCKNTFYLDSDGDGYGDVDNHIFGCTLPSGYTTNGIDCDDNDPNKYPGNAEICDGFDNNCNYLIDEDSVCCPDNLAITDSLETSNLASNIISTVGDVIINSNQNISYKSQSITLRPGFNSKSGSVFRADVDPCSN